MRRKMYTGYHNELERADSVLTRTALSRLFLTKTDVKFRGSTGHVHFKKNTKCSSLPYIVGVLMNEVSSSAARFLARWPAAGC